MKRILFMFLAISILAAFFACGSTEEVIGISKFVEHPALDAVEQGIMDELKEQGYDFKYDLQNANADANAAKTIATKFLSNNVKLAVGIATPSAQALVSTIEEAPVVFSAITDPVDAGLVNSLDGSGTNVTGVSDLTPVKAQIEFIAGLTDIKSIGHIYTSSETNAVVLAGLAEDACDDLGIEFVGTPITNSSEVKQAAIQLAERVDAIYISTDNTVVSAMAAIIEVAEEAGIPIMSADPTSSESGVLAAWGFDYYKMGRVTGRMIVDILKGKDPGSMATMFLTDPQDIELLINLDVAKKLGITIPQSIIDTASTVIGK